MIRYAVNKNHEKQHAARGYCNCGARSCSMWILQRLSTVAIRVEEIALEFDLDPKTVARLTNLDTDLPVGVAAYRGGYLFS